MLQRHDSGYVSHKSNILPVLKSEQVKKDIEYIYIYVYDIYRWKVNNTLQIKVKHFFLLDFEDNTSFRGASFKPPQEVRTRPSQSESLQPVRG